MFPAGRGRIRIIGTVPDIEALKGQTVEIFCNGAVVERRELSFGQFQIEFDWNGNDLQPIYIEIKGTKTFVPSRFGQGFDKRKLNYILQNIEWSDGVHPTRAAVLGPSWTPPKS
jgi:hypothetical protein